MTEEEIQRVYQEIIDIAQVNEIEPDMFFQLLASTCINVMTAINLHNNTDNKEATITFDDGATVVIKLGGHE